MHDRIGHMVPPGADNPPPPPRADPLGADTPPTPQGQTPLGADTPWEQTPGSRPPPGADTPPWSMRRAVCILLDCILVLYVFPIYKF